MSVRYLQQRGDGIVTCILCRTRLGLLQVLVSVSIVLQSSKALKVEEKMWDCFNLSNHNPQPQKHNHLVGYRTVASSFSTDDPAAAWCRCVVPLRGAAAWCCEETHYVIPLHSLPWRVAGKQFSLNRLTFNYSTHTQSL